MVSHTGEETNFGASRPLNAPKSVKVIAGSKYDPCKIQVNNILISVKTIQDRWRIDDEWWREKQISRMYYRCILENHHVLIVFQDLIMKKWYIQAG